MKDESPFYFQILGKIILSTVSVVCLSNWFFLTPSFAEFSSDSELPQEREIYSTLPGSAQEGTILDITNPTELMNHLRRATSMEDATSPSDAIDEALKALEGGDLPPPAWSKSNQL